MGYPKCTNHQPRLFGGLSPPRVKTLPFPPRTGCTGVSRAWGTEILALKCCCQCCYRAWRAVTKLFLPCLSQGSALLGWQSWDTGGSRRTWGVMGKMWCSLPWCPGPGHCTRARACVPGAAGPAENHLGYRRLSTALCSLSAKQTPPPLLAFGFMPPNLGSHTLRSLWLWVLLLRPCRADACLGCSSSGATPRAAKHGPQEHKFKRFRSLLCSGGAFCLQILSPTNPLRCTN